MRAYVCERSTHCAALVPSSVLRIQPWYPHCKTLVPSFCAAEENHWFLCIFHIWSIFFMLFVSRTIKSTLLHNDITSRVVYDEYITKYMNISSSPRQPWWRYHTRGYHRAGTPWHVTLSHISLYAHAKFGGRANIECFTIKPRSCC